MSLNCTHALQTETLWPTGKKIHVRVLTRHINSEQSAAYKPYNRKVLCSAKFLDTCDNEYRIIEFGRYQLNRWCRLRKIDIPEEDHTY